MKNTKNINPEKQETKLLAKACVNIRKSESGKNKTLSEIKTAALAMRLQKT